MVPVRDPRGEAGRHAGAERLLPPVRDERDLSLEDIDELVFLRVPVPERRTTAGLQARQVDTEVGEAERAANRPFGASPEAGAEEFGIRRAEPLGHGGGIERGKRWHGDAPRPSGP